MEQVILVDELDRMVGVMEKMEAHQRGVLHRAFSVLLFNAKGEMLLQKRAGSKYHSGGLWTNACCSHPRPDESMDQAIRRKLQHEIGIAASPSFSHKFIYRTVVGNLIEHELDHVYVGRCESDPVINKAEVEDWKYISTEDLLDDISQHPQHYSYWFRLIMKHQELNLVKV